MRSTRGRRSAARSVKKRKHRKHRKPRRKTLLEVFERLAKRFGTQNWWPADTPFEMIVGAILTQNTSWKNVEKAIGNLKTAGALSPGKLSGLPLEELAALLRPSGFFNLKAERVRAFLRFLSENYEGDLDRMLSDRGALLRKNLLGVKGIGEETADSILLYAAARPVFVVDNYTRRVLARHFWAPEKVSYRDLQRLFMSALPRNPKLYSEYHALIVQVGKLYCRKVPLCSECPLEPMLPPAMP